MRRRVVLGLLLAALVPAVAQAQDSSGGILEADSAAGRIVERDGRLVLVSGIWAGCHGGTCTWTLRATVRGRLVGSARGELRRGSGLVLRIRMGRAGARAFPPGRRVRVVLDAALRTPSDSPLGLRRITYLRRAPRQ